jgi:hypothetical protein
MRHGIGVFATRHLAPGTTIGIVHLVEAGLLTDFFSLPVTGLLRGENVWAVTGGFPFWYLNYNAGQWNVELCGREVRVRATDRGRPTDIWADDELLLAPPFRDA